MRGRALRARKGSVVKPKEKVKARKYRNRSDSLPDRSGSAQKQRERALT